jgi:glycosyltransferase involved in cell wall biosynthesis
MMAHRIVYQSKYSHQLYARYFKFKKHEIVNNGCPTSPILESSEQPGKVIKLVTVYDKYRSSKRIDEIVRFVKWVNENDKSEQFHLTILGYDENHHPKSFTEEIKTSIQTSDFITTQGRFNSLEELKEIYEKQHYFLSFMFRDNCPNVLVEAYSLGLPVIAMKSGGIPDIMGESGIQLDDPTPYTHFSSYDLSFDFPKIDYEQVYTAIQGSIPNYKHLREQTKAHFVNSLEISVVAKSYLALTGN